MSTAAAVQFAIELWGAVFCLISIVCIYLTRRADTSGADKLGRTMFCCALLMGSDALSWLFRGNDGEFAFYAVRISNFGAFLFMYLLLPTITLYIDHLIRSRSGKNIRGIVVAEWMISVVGIALLIVNAFKPFMYDFDANNTYFRLKFSFLSGVVGNVGVILLILCMFVNLKFSNSFEKFAITAFLTLPVAASILQLFNYGISYTYISLNISILLLFFSYEFNFMQYNIELEHQLTQDKIRLVNKQMQPHFIFNCLATIRYLCRNDQNEAVQAINEFSGYMRSMTQMLNESSCILAKDEIELVKNYIALEQKRFGDDLVVEYDMQDLDFEIPPFAVETLVENAIKHGLRSKTGKGQIKVSSKFQGGRHIVCVEDNGVGFDISEAEKSAGNEKIGLKNTADRLKLMCGGTLAISSAVNQGTKATIIIPERG